jgi:hypothetical protein
MKHHPSIAILIGTQCLVPSVSHWHGASLSLDCNFKCRVQNALESRACVARKIKILARDVMD